VTTPANTLLAALAHERRGWSVLPLSGKAPNTRLIRASRGRSSWQSFREQRAGEDEIRDWFEHEPDTNVGLICGQISGGLAVVDVDADIETATLPRTATVATGRGQHFYYRSSEPLRSRDFDWGELRAEGRYIVAPASRHESGCRYSWLVSPDEIPLADFDDVDFPRATAGLTREIFPTARESFGIYKASTPITLVGKMAPSRLAELELDESIALALAAALEIPPVPYGTAFECVVHGDRNPSATLYPAEDGRILYHDFHRRGRQGEWLSLAQVRAARAGRPYASGPELAVWKLRLLAEARLVEPVKIEAPALVHEEGFVEAVWRGFLFLVGCRWLVEPGVGAPFARRFASAWCELPEWQLREGFGRLVRLGLVVPAGEEARLALWLPLGLAPGAAGVNDENGRR
jgi:Bifunctional DNA primase/polymerase, N-terminal